MVINGEVLNQTLCNNADCRHYTFLPLLGRVSETITATQLAAPLFPAPLAFSEEVDAVTAERYVANGIMMVVVEPMTASIMFTPTQPVEASVRIDLRLGPGSNYAAPWDIARYSPGVIMSHPLNGIYAKGAFWWKVDFGSAQGWVKQGDLVAIVDVRR